MAKLAAHSTDGGQTFSANVRVSDFPFTPNPTDQFGGKFIGDYIGVAATEGTLRPVWTTLVVTPQKKGPTLQDYEVFFDNVSTAGP